VVAAVDKFWVIIFHFMLKRRKKKKVLIARGVKMQ